MKVYLDRSACNVWEAACESDLSWHIEHKTFCPACMVETIEDEHNDDEVTLVIKDRDGSEKILVLTDENRADAMDSWMLLWEKQQTESR